MFIYLFILSLAAIDHHMHPTSLFNDYYMRHSKNSVLADVLKTKQSHHKGKKRDLKDADMEIETESTNNEDQLLNKVIPSQTHVIIDGGTLLRQVFCSGTTFKVGLSSSKKIILYASRKAF